MFVFHRVGNTARQKLNHIGLAYQPQLVLPKRHGALHADTLGSFHTRLVYLGMHRLATQRVDVFIKHLLQVNQAALARAVVPVLQGRQRDLFRFGCHGDFLIFAELK